MLTDKEKLEEIRVQVAELNHRLARMDIEFLSLVQTVQRLVLDSIHNAKVSAQD